MAAKERRERKEAKASDSRAGVRAASRMIARIFGARTALSARSFGSSFSGGQSGPHSCGFGEVSVSSLPSLAAAFRKSEIGNRKCPYPCSSVSSVVNQLPMIRDLLENRRLASLLSLPHNRQLFLTHAI
jgi:hypothetical protein